MHGCHRSVVLGALAVRFQASLLSNKNQGCRTMRNLNIRKVLRVLKIRVVAEFKL